MMLFAKAQTPVKHVGMNEFELLSDFSRKGSLKVVLGT